MTLEHMAEGTAGLEEAQAGSQIGPGMAEGSVKPQISEEKVFANASLADKERLQAAKELLETQLTPEQEQAILEAHKAGLGEPGKNNSEAGIYNYKLGQLREKARILKEAGFDKEQIRSLMESGLAGRLPPTEFAAFDPNAYDGDPKLTRIAGKIKATGDAGLADEGFLYKTSMLLKRLDAEAEVDVGGAQDILDNLKGWQSKADDPLLPYFERVRLEEQAQREGDSEFSMIKVFYEHYSSMDITPLSPALQVEIKDRIDTYRTNILKLIDQADQKGVLADVRSRALDFYKQYKVAKRHDKWGRDKQQIIDYARQGYKETFWDDSPTLKQFEGVFRGAAGYLWDGVVSEVYKEMSNQQESSLNVIAEEEFRKIQEQRRIDRLSEKKYETSIYYGRRSYELTAENAGELPGAILGWVRDQLAEIPDTDMETVDGKLKEIRAEADQLLGTRRVHLETDEGQDVPETHPDFLRAKAAVEAVTDSVGYEKIISWDEKIAYESGGEVAASYAGRYASNYIGHHDAVYLMRRVARILLKLRTHKEGTYWTGHPFSEEKVDIGYVRTYRQELQEEIIEDAVTHDIFTETILAENQGLFKDLIQTPEDEEALRLGYTGFFELREKYKLQYSHNDPLEKMLLDPGDVIRQKIVATGDTEALRRHDTRVKVFRDIKARRDAEDGLAGFSSSQRINAIRQKIIGQMMLKINEGQFTEETKKARLEMETARMQNDPIAYDKAMWKWVEDYNNYRVKQGLHIEGDAYWYPTSWDMIRMKIDRAEKVLDRKLTDEQIEAMYELVKLPPGTSLTDYRVALALDESRFGFQVARGNAMLEMEDALYGGIRTRIRDPNTGEIIDQDHKVRRVFDIVQERLEKAIAEEEAELTQFRTTKEAEINQAKIAHDFEKAKKLQIELDQKILSAQFLATHALKAAGYVDGKLPCQDGQLRSDTVINYFANILAAYGVNVAFGEKISHNSKDMLYEIIERERRAWQSEWNRAAQEEMVGTYPVPELDYDANGNLVPQYDAQGKAIKAKAYRKNAFGEEVRISERKRIVNPGSPNEHQGITDPRFNSSTSGGIAVPEFTDELADYLFAPPMAKLGVISIAGLHGYIKGLDEVQAISRQKIFTSMDAEYSAKERIAAYIAKRAFMGGKNAEGKLGPGFGNEPFHGGFKTADWLIEHAQFAQQHGMNDLSKYLQLMQRFRFQEEQYSAFLDTYSGITVFFDKSNKKEERIGAGDLEKLRQMTYLEFDKLTKQEQNTLYTTLYGVYDYFQDYLKARKGCIQSRGGRALRSWEEENYKAFYAFRREIREAIMGKKDENGKWVRKPEQGFIIRLGYAPEVASEIAIRMLEVVLMDADYLDLRGYEVGQRVRDGEDILSKALTDQETREGFQVHERDEKGNILRTFSTFVVPEEQDWEKNVAEDRVRKALQNIRRRGLLEFMREEGYKIYERDNAGQTRVDQQGKRVYYKEILGQKLPPVVQDIKIKEDSRRIKNAFNP